MNMDFSCQHHMLDYPTIPVPRAAVCLLSCQMGKEPFTVSSLLDLAARSSTLACSGGIGCRRRP